MKKLLFILFFLANLSSFGQNKAFFRQNEPFQKALFENAYYLKVQFKQIPDYQERQKISEKGVFFGNYYGKNTYYLKIEKTALANFLKNNRIEKVEIFEEKNKLQSQIFEQKTDFVDLEILYFKNAPFASINKELEKINAQILDYEPLLHYLSIRIPTKNLVFLQEQIWLEAGVLPENHVSLDASGREQAGAAGLSKIRNLDGSGVHIGIFEAASSGNFSIDPHVDFTARHTQVELSGSSQHATGVCSNMTGGGILDPSAMGIAPKSKTFGYRSTANYRKMVQAVQDYGISISQNSWGVAQNCAGRPYGFYEHLRDKSSELYPNLLQLYSAGNVQNACAGGWNTLQSGFNKNCITVGGINPQDMVTGGILQSSFGTVFDGRLKPDVVALSTFVYSAGIGNSYWTSNFGTSQSCPMVSGVAALLIQRYRQLNNSEPGASLLRAMICNSAKDLENSYIDYKTGFGRINGIAAVKTIEENRYKTNEIEQAQTQNYTISVPSNSLRLRVLIAWTDLAGGYVADPNGTNPALVNDLDLKIIAPDGSIFLPWILDKNNPSALAVRGMDRLNNIEQITIDNPKNGTYQIQVNGFALPIEKKQAYSLVWQVDKPSIELQNPVGGESFTPTKSTYLRWEAYGLSGNFDLDYSTDNGITWTSIGSTTNDYYDWTIPSVTSGNCLFRVRNSAYSAISKKFSIIDRVSSITPTSSNNTVNLTWLPSTGATSYDVLKLNNRTGEYETICSDISSTNCVVNNLINGVTYWFTVISRNNANNALSERAIAVSAVPSGAGAATDLKLESILNPTTSICFANRNPETITIELKNVGLNTLTNGTTINVSYQIDTQSPVNESFITADILAGASVFYNFTNTANFSQTDTFLLKTSVSLPSDLFIENNSLSKSIINKPANILTDRNPNFCGGSVVLAADNIPISNYSVSNIAFSPENMTGASIIPFNSYMARGLYPIGFDFNFFGKTYTNFHVSAEGIIGFSEFLEVDDAIDAALTIPNTSLINNFIAACKTDLDINAGGTISYMTKGSFPNRKLIVHYDNVRYFGSTNTASFQIILNESTNLIDIQAIDIQAFSTNKTMGIENADGTAGIAVAGRNNASWTSNNEAFRFSPDYSTLLWNTGANSQTISVNTAGVYSYSYINGSCVYSKSINFTDACSNPPTLISTFPTDNAVDILPTTFLKMVFSEDVFSDFGSVILSDGLTDSFISAGDTKISKNEVLIPLPQKLETGKNYFVKVQGNAFKDNSTNFYTGISDAITWNFSTQNQSPTDIQLCSEIIDETTSVGTAIADLSSTDPDISQSHTYSIIGGTGLGIFQIVGNQVVVNAPLNYSTNSSYTLQIQSTDNGTPTKSISKNFVLFLHNYKSVSAGADQTICFAGSAFMHAQSFGTQTGVWYFLEANPAATTLPTIVSPNSPTSEISGLEANKTYSFVWKNTNLPISCRYNDEQKIKITVLNNATVSTTNQSHWLGVQSSAWFDCRNWVEQQIPSNLSTAHIQNTATNQPFVTSFAYLDNCFVSAAEQLTISTNSVLELQNDFVNSGNLNNFGQLKISRNLENNNLLNQHQGKISFVGSQNSFILGASFLSAYQLEVNKTNASLTLQKDVSIKNQLNFNSGVIYSFSTALLIFEDNSLANGANANSFVNGKVRKIGNDAFVFPTGKNSFFSRIAISDLTNTNTNDHFTAEYFDTPYSNISSLNSPLLRVSKIEHWILERSGNTQVKVNLYWENGSRSGITLLSDLKVCRFDGTNWNSEGNSQTLGTTANGYITSNSITNFSPFTFGSSEQEQNPLPIEWLSVSAKLQNKKAFITWKSLQDGKTLYYEVQRSYNGLDFEPIGRILPKMDKLSEYNFVDSSIKNDTSYYRICEISEQNTKNCSRIIAVWNRTSFDKNIWIFPNPIQENFIQFQVKSRQKGSFLVRIIDVVGREIIAEKLAFEDGENLQVISQKLQKGVYILQIPDLGLWQRFMVK